MRMRYKVSLMVCSDRMQSEISPCVIRRSLTAGPLANNRRTNRVCGWLWSETRKFFTQVETFSTRGDASLRSG